MSPARQPAQRALGPLAELIDLLGRRHALALVWELRAGARAFPVLTRAVHAPGPLLSQRLAELRERGLVEVDELGDYRLTAAGRRLQGVLEPAADVAAQLASLTPRQRRPRGAASRGRDEP